MTRLDVQDDGGDEVAQVDVAKGTVQVSTDDSELRELIQSFDGLERMTGEKPPNPDLDTPSEDWESAPDDHIVRELRGVLRGRGYYVASRSRKNGGSA